MLVSWSAAKEAWALRPFCRSPFFFSLSLFFPQRRSDSNTNREQWQKQVLFLFFLSSFYLASSSATGENLDAKRLVTSTKHTHAFTPFDNRPWVRMRRREWGRINVWCLMQLMKTIERLQGDTVGKRERENRFFPSPPLSLSLDVQGQTYVSIDNGNDEYILENMTTNCTSRSKWGRIDVDTFTSKWDKMYASECFE